MWRPSFHRPYFPLDRGTRHLDERKDYWPAIMERGLNWNNLDPQSIVYLARWTPSNLKSLKYDSRHHKYFLLFEATSD